MYKHILLFTLITVMSVLSVKSQQIVALTASNELVQIANPAMPSSASSPMSITGIMSGQMLVGIDYRPNTGELYALGYNSSMSMNNAQLYTINLTTGMATAIGASSTLNLGTSGIAFDFNPAVDRIRVIGENGTNYRLHPITGALLATDGNLAYAGTDANFGIMPAIAACAYTNSYIGSETTTLLDYDKNLNVLASQIPPNNGTLNTLGSSGIMVASGSNIGMDIYFNPINKTNMGYLNATVGGMNNLYSISITTGATSLLGTIGTGMMAIRDIAVVIDRTVPPTYSGQLVYALTRINRNLITFSTDNPELIRTIMPVTGIAAGQTIVGIDVRPADRNLYALGYHDTSSTFQLYTINKNTGVATAVGTPGTMNLGMGQRIGFDFNPVVDRIRVVSTNDNSFRLHPVTGALVATDLPLSYAATDVNAGKNPNISTVGYINSFAGATSTTLFALDDSNNAFCNIIPPNNGVVNTISALAPFNINDLTNDLDFFYDSTVLQNKGYLAANFAGSTTDKLYMITTDGMVSLIDTIGLGVQLYDIAVQITYTGSLTNGTKTTHTQCGGSYTWASNNMTYTQSGTYYTGSSGTMDTLVLTINPLPTVMASNVSGCTGSMIALMGSPAGGTFSVANPYMGPSTTYTYMYTDANGCMNTSAPATITVSNAPQINNVTVTNISGSTAQINWDGVPGLAWYEVRYRTMPSMPWTMVTQVAPTTSKQIVGLTPSSMYEVQVRGFCTSSSAGAWSNSMMFMTGTGCMPPMSMMVSNITSNSAMLNWMTVTGAAWYDTRYRVAGSTNWINGTAVGSSTSKNIVGLAANQTYEWQIRTRCNPAPNSNASAWSMSQMFTTTSLKDNNSIISEEFTSNFAPDISIFPNPFTEKVAVHVNSDLNEQTTVSIYDISGRMVKQLQAEINKGMNSIEIDMSHLSTGLYTIKLYTNDRLIHTSKLSKQQ